MSESQLDLSVVLPVYNEQDSLGPLIAELEDVLGKLGKTYEIIGVDDTSTDDSLGVLGKLQETRPFLRVIRHRINSGESAAIATGYEHARGEVVISMDADQQNDPADIPAVLAALKPGVAAVCGVRRKREDNWVRRASSRIANNFRNWVTHDAVTDAGCTFRAVRKDALREVLVFNGMHRFLPTILRLQGYAAVEIPVNHRPRTHGKSKYGVGNRAWRGLVDCLGMRWYRARAVRADRAAAP